MRRLLAVCTAGMGLAAGAGCGGSTTVMGYRWPDSGDWQGHVLPPRVLQVAAAPGGYSAPLTRAAHNQIAVCESIASAYGELARHRVETGTFLAGSGIPGRRGRSPRRR